MQCVPFELDGRAWDLNPAYAKPAIAPFAQAFQTAKSSGALSNPDVNQKVSQLVFQIAAASDALSWNTDTFVNQNIPSSQWPAMLGLIRMGRKQPDALQMKSAKDYIFPVAYIAGAAYIAFFLLCGDFFTPDFASRFATDFYHTKFFTSIAGLGLTALGLPVYWLWKKSHPANPPGTPVT